MARMAKWRRHSVEFKRQAVERMKTCLNIHDLARELKIQRKLLYTWKYQFEGRPEPRHANLGITAEDRTEKRFREDTRTRRRGKGLGRGGPGWGGAGGEKGEKTFFKKGLFKKRGGAPRGG